ncbi:hypothetical protein OIO90_001092 [Microbotryomycetes sp. JL221]|nr:hypothetical protein OIO90_001092 [Microbotryomycetes sp. JL221]
MAAMAGAHVLRTTSEDALSLTDSHAILHIATSVRVIRRPTWARSSIDCTTTNAAAKMGLALLKDEKPRSSITSLIDILTTDKYEEDDYEGITELVEVTNLQHTGPQEAARCIRKKLKYSNVHGQLRALTILNALVSNCNTRFKTTFADERLVDRIKVMAGDPHTDERVKKKLMGVLGSWYRQFKDEPRMSQVAGLFGACGGGKKSRSAATEAYERQQAKYEQEARERAERKAQLKAKEKEDKEKEKAARRKAQATRTRRPPFNFQQEKPKIMQSVGTGTQSAQALVNALQHVNREKESVTTNERVQDCLTKAKADRKAIVRYIQLVDMDQEGDYIGALIATNEQILNALQLYDRMSKPVDLDSDDEHVEEAKRQTLAAANANNNDDDTQSIRSRLSAFDMQDREVDKLQHRQRVRVDRVNRARAAGVHPDLQDLAFGSTAGRRVLPVKTSTLPTPIQPRSAEDEYRHGSLSDYSDGSTDYSSDDDRYYGVPAPASNAAAAGSSSRGAGSARAYAQYIQDEDERAGNGRGLLEDQGDDPFADPDDDASLLSAPTPGVETQNKRMEWREV